MAAKIYNANEYLDELKLFIDFLYAELNSIRNPSYTKKKKKVFLPLYVNALDMGGSIHVILEDERVNASKNLLRSLLESWFDSAFIYIDSSDLWVDSYLLESEKNKKSFAKGLLQIKGKHPGVAISPIFSDVRLNRMISQATAAETKFSSKYPLIPAMPGIATRDLVRKNLTLKDRTVAIDNRDVASVAPYLISNSQELQYQMVYKHLSGGAHIDAGYLATNLLQRNRTVTSIHKHGDKADIPLIAWSTFAILYDIATIFGDKFGRPNKTALRPFKNALDDLGDQL